MNEEDPFEILGIHENAQHEDIQLAYESRCMQYHPDRYVGQDEKKQELGQQQKCKRLRQRTSK